MRRRRAFPIGLCVTLVLTSACATSAFQGHGTVGHEDAAAVFARDTALSWNPDALYSAAKLHASPDRSTYDPDRAAELLATFIERFPTDPRRRDASDRLALVNEVRSLRAELRALKAIDLARPPRN
jgi:hypothetical protein